jgi:hypothetical protein
LANPSQQNLHLFMVKPLHVGKSSIYYWLTFYFLAKSIPIDKTLVSSWLNLHCLCQKNLNKICMQLSNLKRPLSKLIFISHHVMCSSISCCNHLNSMLMNVKLMVIQLELNGIGYIVVFHNYSKFTSNTWYTIIYKFEKCKPNSQKITWVWTYIVSSIFLKRKFGKRKYKIKEI